MKVLLRVMLPSILVLAITAGASAQWRVWTVSETRRVLREDLPENGVAVRLGTAKNE